MLLNEWKILNNELSLMNAYLGYSNKGHPDFMI